MRLGGWAVLLVCAAAAAPALAQVTLYENDDYGGRSVTAQRAQTNLTASGFNDRASSAIVTRDRWEVCVDANFSGPCRVLRPGNYPSLASMGLNDRISSLRRISVQARIDDERYGPAPLVVQDFRRRGTERLFEAPVTSVHVVMGAPEQRCWIEREQLGRGSDGRGANVPGAVLGAVIGGILGHQVGGGTGRDLATLGGVVGGGVLGSRVGNDTQRRQGAPLQRCAPQADTAQPAYWEVVYLFRGRQHRVQLNHEPGATITVNAQGEPRG